MDDFEAGHAADGEERRQREVWQAEMEEGRAKAEPPAVAARERGELRRRVAEAGEKAARGFVAEQHAAIAALNEELRPAGAAGEETRVLVWSFMPNGSVKPYGLFAEADDARKELGIRFRGTWNEDRTRYSVEGNCGVAGFFDLLTMRVQRFGA